MLIVIYNNSFIFCNTIINANYEAINFSAIKIILYYSLLFISLYIKTVEFENLICVEIQK